MYKTVNLEEEYEKLREERNKWRWKYNRLKSEFNLLQDKNKTLKERIKELEQCNLNLQTWIDNKEKVNKQLREELQEWLNAVWNK